MKDTVTMLVEALDESTRLLKRILLGQEWGAIEEYIDDNEAALSAAKGGGDGWLHDRGLLYVLKDGVNHFEVNVTMVNGSRAIQDREAFAKKIMALLPPPPKD